MRRKRARPLQLANRARAMDSEQRRYVCDVLGWDIDDFVSQVYSSTTGMADIFSMSSSE